MLSRLWPAMSEEAGVGEMPVPDTSSLETVLPLVAMSISRKMLAAPTKELEAQNKELEAKNKELLAKSTKQEAMLAAKIGELERRLTCQQEASERNQQAAKAIQLEAFKRAVRNWSFDLYCYIIPRTKNATLREDIEDWLRTRATSMHF
eukprot:3374001-Amphidinium_carterae.1